ncbi:DUF4138 domain-containing protein [Tenacibaculum finnmarkense]|uniref:DUF4138 domain-containing protein n=1 Tax=Tenacibaculum finnmarkense TaxID=2781243 RepID=UPI001EFACCBB|nr:DUF4138 domain-containing protein [Tenacibaculum finnmarkense]MCG8226376.1 DUF4138 domain-containing protein [Tenacibaculum finnmarkense genomovar finnmarkense]
MKTIFLNLMIFTVLFCQGQNNNLQTIYLNKNVTTHLLSKVHLDDIDLSTTFVAGMLRNKKIISIKPISDEQVELGILSIIGQDYFIQFRLKYTNSIDYADKRINIDSKEDNYFLHPNYSMTNIDMYNYSKKIEKLKPNYNNTSTKANKLIINLNNIIVKENLVFVDFSILNKTNLMYNVDDVKYMIDDKKITKNNNIQRILLNPNFEFNKDNTFKRHYRNIVCFDKMTFPDNKVFVIELSEKQISGRTARLFINYLDILNADKL